MSYTKKQFIEDVKKEARALRRNATKEEVAKLDTEILHPTIASSCLYGLMTGNCFSKRAAELIHGCCKKYFASHNDEESITMEAAAMEGRPELVVNGAKVKGVKNAQDLYRERKRLEYHYSAIETYIITPNAKNANLIAYLKGETNDLVL